MTSIGISAPTAAASGPTALNRTMESDPTPVPGAGEERVFQVDGADLLLVGVTWQASDTADVTAQLRTRSGDQWSKWEELPISDDAPDDAAQGRGGTDPALITDATDIEVRLRAGAAGLPADVQLARIDPDEDAPAVVRPQARSMPRTSSTYPGVEVRTRAEWGADESIRTWPADTGEVTGAVIHHTAGSNNYGPDDVPAIIRGIYRYHAIDRNWGDIGYNVLVDRFGRAWEGRYGGWQNAIIGGHAVGYNATTFGISILGNYETAPAPAAAVETIAEVIGAKFQIHGITTEGKAQGVGGPVNRIVGHRDVSSTLCPGANIYSEIGRIYGLVDDYLAPGDLVAGFTDVRLDHPFATEIAWLVDQEITTGYPDATFRPKGKVTREALAAFLYRHAADDDFEPPATSPFRDVPTSHSFYKEITWAAARGITSGYSDDTFRPRNPITREAVAAFLYRYAEVDVTPRETQPFTDVPESHGFHDEIAWLAAQNITSGYTDGTFRPQNTVTREAIAAYLHRYSPFIDVPRTESFYREITWLAHQGIATGAENGVFSPRAALTRETLATFLYRHAQAESIFTPPGTPPFSDVPGDHDAYAEITWLADAGITSGYGDGTFRPAGAVTREAVAAFFYRYADASSQGYTPPSSTPFSDVPTTHSYYEPITWLADAGITSGYADGTFRPKTTLTRQAAAAYLYRLHHSTV